MKINLFPFLLLLIAAVPVSASGDRIDSLLSVLELQEENVNLEEMYFLHQALGKAYAEDELYEAAISRFHEGLKIAEQLGDIEKIANSLFDLGFAKDRRTEYPEAMQYYVELLQLQGIDENNELKINALSQVSSIHQALGNYNKAFEFQIKALQFHEFNDNKQGIAWSNYRLGTIFFYQKQFHKALEQYEKSKAICDELDNQRDIYSCIAALGSVHAELGNHEQNLYFNNQSLQLAQKLNYKMGIAYSMGNIGSTYLTQGNCSKAKEYILQSIEIKSELNDTWGLIGSKISLAQVYKECNAGDLLVPLMQEVIELSIELDSKPRELEAYEILIDFYDQKGNIKLAYGYQKKYLALKDIVLNEKTVTEMGQSKRRYEIEKKEQQISLLKKENELLVSNEKVKELQTFIFAIIGLMLILVCVWFFTRLKDQRAVNSLLGEKNNLLNSKNEEIAIKNKQLEYSNEDLERFAYVASHDLKEPLRMIHSYTTLLERRSKGQLDDSSKEFMFYIVDAASRMQTLLDDLLDYSRCSMQQKQPNKLVAVSDVLLLVQSNLQHNLAASQAQLIINPENLPTIKAHQTQLIQLFQNLVSNGLKFKGEKSPMVMIDCKQEGPYYHFSIQDNGIGISPENQQKIFEMFKRLHTRQEYEGTGIGLATCKRIVGNMGGEIWVESSPGQGSTFYFSVPVPVQELALVD